MGEIAIPNVGWLGWHNEDYGCILALRKAGDEALFASQSKKSPLRWVPITEFQFEPSCIATPKDVRRRDLEA